LGFRLHGVNLEELKFVRQLLGEADAFEGAAGPVYGTSSRGLPPFLCGWKAQYASVWPPPIRAV